MTIHAATDARRESARGNGVAHAGQFGHQSHSAPAGFDDTAAELENRQEEIADRLDSAMTHLQGPGFRSLRGVVETGDDGVSRLRVTEISSLSRWGSLESNDASIRDRIGVDDFEGEIGQLYADRSNLGGHNAADEPVFELRRDDDGHVSVAWEDDRSQDSYDEDELHDAEFNLQAIIIDDGVAHARDELDEDDPELEIFEDSTVDTLSDSAKEKIAEEWDTFRDRAQPLLREAEGKYNYDLGDAAGDWYLGQIGDGFVGRQRIGTDARAREIALRLDHLRRDLSPSLGDRSLALSDDGEFILE